MDFHAFRRICTWGLNNPSPHHFGITGCLLADWLAAGRRLAAWQAAAGLLGSQNFKDFRRFLLIFQDLHMEP